MMMMMFLGREPKFQIQKRERDGKGRVIGQRNDAISFCGSGQPAIDGGCTFHQGVTEILGQVIIIIKRGL